MINYEEFKAKYKEMIDALPLYQRVYVKASIRLYELWYWHIGKLLWRWFKIDIYGGNDG